ncbi:MAG: NUDIX hydrolase [Propionibacteriaceae bacterium]|jgi:ADP-ribose pyrophosphatase|nr:NUDIX hydrolase [Propionibacteriaceae bacterium]
MTLPGPVIAAEDLDDRRMEWPSRRLATTTGVLMDFVVDEIDAPDGSTLTRNYLRHPGAVGIVALDDEDRIAVVRQFRHQVGAELVEAPAGLLDHAGEDSWAAARRELAEEALLEASDWRILIDCFSSPGASTEAIRIFLARGLAPARRPDGFVLEGEEAAMTLGWAHLDEVVEAILAGRLHNPTIIMGALALSQARRGGLDRLRPPDAPWPGRPGR